MRSEGFCCGRRKPSNPCHPVQDYYVGDYEYDSGDYGLDYVDTARHARIGGGAVLAGAPC